MSPNAFIGKKSQPGDAELSQALGSAMPVWKRVIDELEEKFGVNVREWSSYSPKAGWSLRLKKGKRTIVWMAPCDGLFLVAFILGDKAVTAAHEGKLPARVISLLDKADRYPEGTGLRLEVKAAKDLPTIMKLAEIKLAN